MCKKQDESGVLWKSPGLVGFRGREEERGWHSTGISHPSRCSLPMWSHCLSLERVSRLTDEAQRSWVPCPMQHSWNGEKARISTSACVPQAYFWWIQATHEVEKQHRQEIGSWITSVVKSVYPQEGNLIFRNSQKSFWVKYILWVMGFKGFIYFWMWI